MTKTRRWRAATLLAGAALVVASCGSDSESTSTSAAGTPTTAASATTDGAPETTGGATETTGGATETTGGATDTTGATGDTVAQPQTELDSTSAQDINPQPRENLEQGGELRSNVASFAENWNPWNVNGNELDFSAILGPLSPTLFDFDKESVATPNENFLLDVQVDDGPPQVVTYTLNPEAKWNSGTPITAADFIALNEAMNNPDNQVVTTEGYDQIASVEQGEDEFQVIVTFAEVYPDWQGLFTPLVPAESVATPEMFNEGWTGEINTDWFAGPFTVGSYDAAQGIIEEVPNPDWWGDPALLDAIIWRTVDPAAAPQAYANGELDSFDIGPDPNGFAIADSTSGGVVRAAAGPNWRHITFNSTAGLIADQTIRQAIVRSLDRSEIGASDLAGIPWAAKPLNNHIFVENQAGYEDNAGDFAFDPDRARADLEAAGWVEGDDGIREKDGQRLTVKFSQLVGVPVSENEAQLVQAQLGDVGIEVEIVDVDTADFSEVLTSGDFELIAFSWIGTPFPFGGVQQIYGTGSESNFAQSELPEVDELAAQIAVETDPVERTRLANEVDKVLWDFVHTLPLYQRPELVGQREDLANWGAFGFSTPIYEDIGYMS